MFLLHVGVKWSVYWGDVLFYGPSVVLYFLSVSKRRYSLDIHLGGLD